MYYDAMGNPNPTGGFEFVDGSLVLRKDRTWKEGEYLSFDINFFDAARSTAFSDSKPSDEPGSIGEAVRQGLAAEAERHKGGDVKAMVASMSPYDFEKLVAKIVAGHIRAKTGEAVVGDSTMVTDAEADYRVAAARAKHDLMHPGKPFTADQAAAARAGDSYLASVAAAQASAAAFLDGQASYDHGARIARKNIISNAWRR